MPYIVSSRPPFSVAENYSTIQADRLSLVNGGQTFEWGEPACSGDEITTTAKCISIDEKLGNGFYVFETTSVNGAGAEVVRGTWTNIVRGV